jgi:hypothetical protein
VADVNINWNAYAAGVLPGRNRLLARKLSKRCHGFLGMFALNKYMIMEISRDYICTYSVLGQFS